MSSDARRQGPLGSLSEIVTIAHIIPHYDPSKGPHRKERRLCDWQLFEPQQSSVDTRGGRRLTRL